VSAVAAALERVGAEGAGTAGHRHGHRTRRLTDRRTRSPTGRSFRNPSNRPSRMNSAFFSLATSCSRARWTSFWPGSATSTRAACGGSTSRACKITGPGALSARSGCAHKPVDLTPPAHPRQPTLFPPLARRKFRRPLFRATRLGHRHLRRGLGGAFGSGLRGRRFGLFEARPRAFCLLRPLHLCCLHLCCLRDTSAFRLLDHCPLLLTSASQEVREHSGGRSLRCPYRAAQWRRVVLHLRRLCLTIEAGEDPFGLSTSLALGWAVREVLVDIALGRIVWRDGVHPVVVRRG
jgi:hypothetical protein